MTWLEAASAVEAPDGQPALRSWRMKLQITFAMWAISTAAMATTQIPDFIVLDGAREPVYSKPHILLTELQGSNEWKRQTHDPRCSASVRGYNSDWEVRDGMLFLIAVHLNPCAANPLSVPLERIFPSTKGPDQPLGTPVSWSFRRARGLATLPWAPWLAMRSTCSSQFGPEWWCRRKRPSSFPSGHEPSCR